MPKKSDSVLCRPIDKIGAEIGKCQSELVRDAIAAYLGKTEPEAKEKMSRRVAQLENQVKALLLS